MADKKVKAKKFTIEASSEEILHVKQLEFPWWLVFLCIFAIAFLLICIWLLCSSCSLSTCHAVVAVIAVILMFTAAKQFRPSIAGTLIGAILLMLIGYIMYNPSTNSIPIKWLSICNYCRLSFYTSFQNEMHGVCLMCDDKVLKNVRVINIFPEQYVNVNNDLIRNSIEQLKKEPDILLSLVCASTTHKLMCKLEKAKQTWLEKIYKCLDQLKKDGNVEDVKCLEKEITKIIILDQVVLIAAEQAISGCSCSHDNENNCRDDHKFFLQSVDFKETKDTHLKETLIED